MSITKDLAAATMAANNLSNTVKDKLISIEQRATEFATQANDAAIEATATLKRLKIGIQQGPALYLTVEPEDDAGLMVKEAFAAGAKYVNVAWNSDGKDRHWNTHVIMPVGTTLRITGPVSSVSSRAGAVRSGWSSYANGSYQGTSENGSPMIFRNLELRDDDLYPVNDHVKVWDNSQLIDLSGNNTVVFFDGTYVFDQGGMTANAYGHGLIHVTGYHYGMTNAVVGGGVFCQFYLSGPLVNNNFGGSTCEVRIMAGQVNKLSSDGPLLTVNKGFKKLQSNGVAGITNSFLNRQPYEVTAVDAALNNNNPVYAGSSYSWFKESRGVDTDADKPRLIGTSTWAYAGGWTMTQFSGTIGDVSTYGMAPIADTDVHMSVK
ncbi:MAG: hypothetical protein ACI8WB_000701 [Phenylobacterium sp.]|jgi:hypothetical protein